MSPRPPLHVRVSARAAVYEIEDRLYLRLDAEGRWSAFAERGAIFRRRVDGGVVRARGRRFETLDDEGAAVVHAWVGRRAAALLETLASGAPNSSEGDVEALARLRGAAHWSRERLLGECERFQAAYPEPIPILPPHRYLDVVLLPATGCPNHACTFCTLYRDRPFRALDDGAFDRHLSAVGALFGRALGERDGCFLGSASALSLPDPVLRRRLRRIRQVLGPLRRGVAAFLDPDRAPRRMAGDWARLSEEGLVEATLGLETGWEPLRERLGKAGDLSVFRDTVEKAKAGGLDLSLTVLVGLGQDEAEERAHLEGTAAFLRGLPLDRGDRIYLSPLVGDGALRVRPQPRRWRDALAEVTAARFADYRIDLFAWLA